MKFDLLSDIHEDVHRGFDLNPPNQGSTILVLAGDLAEYRSIAYSKFKTLRAAAFMYDHVIYVAGNHEFYGENYQKTVIALRRGCAEFSNVHFLHNETFEVPETNIAFVGGTCFTDMNGDDPLTKARIRDMMNDFVYITYGEENPLIIPNSQWDFDGVGQQDNFTHIRRITPDDYVREHKIAMDYFASEAKRLHDKKIVLVTHHALSDKSVMPRYAMQYHMNGGYRSCYDAFFNAHPNIAVHCHGHMHDFIRYQIANTRVFCNPRGYPHEEPRGFEQIQIEI